MDVARKSWELDNQIKLVDPTRDALYNFRETAEYKETISKRPWATDLNYFRSVRISAVALIKMVMHARSGGSIEIMGLMQGYVDGAVLVVTDAFRLPVEGTETRVNALEDANEYMVEYPRLGRDQGRPENLIGWYHSHPGYGCWLSGIDVGTQRLHQQFNDPFVAVVIDPDRTVSAGKVEIGAFRTYPESHQSTDGPGGVLDGSQTVPLSKADDFGAHASQYYSLEIEHFKSILDSRLLELLWNKYWVQTLSQSPIFTNRAFGNKQVADLASKTKDAVALIQRAGRSGSASVHGGSSLGMSANSMGPAERFHATIGRLARNGRQVATREKSALMAGAVKATIFNDVEHLG